MDTLDPRHGTYAGGRVHRADDEPVCDACRRAEARYEQQRQLDLLAGRPRRVPALGIQRRIRALVALGHSFARIGEAMDMSGSGAWAFAHRDKAYAWATTAAKVDAVYEQWCMTLPPTTNILERKAASYARTVAAKHGWLPPLAWDDIDDDPAPTVDGPHVDIDPVVVERFLAGDIVTTTPAERREIVRRWPTTGRSLADLARVTGWKPERYTTPGAAA